MLNEEQWMEIYTASIETRKDIVWIRKELNRNDKEIEDCRKNLKELEVSHSFKKGKVASLTILLTALITIMVNGVLWLFNSFGGTK